MDKQTSMATAAAIALGSNLGDSLATLTGAVQTLRETAGIEQVQCSRWYRTKPVGPPQPDYVNGCLTCVTTLAPADLLQVLLGIEQKFGRERREKWGARTLDLDILLYGDRLIDLPELQVPHPRMVERAFVLVPLAEIAPDWQHPITLQSIKTLGDRLESSGIQCISQEAFC